MKEIALHILDILENAVRADSDRIDLTVDVNRTMDTLDILIRDNGSGMNEKTVKSVTDPFFTTRSTRKVGLGLPLFLDSTKRSGGSLNIQSKPGEGTLVKARYCLSHIDRPPVGNLTETIVTFLTSSRPIRLIFQYSVDGNSFRMDTLDVKKKLGEVPLNEPEVLCWLSEYIQEGINSCGGGLE